MASKLKYKSSTQLRVLASTKGIGTTMMDALEAIKGLDGYAETLAGLSALLGAKMFDDKSAEQEGLRAQIQEKQKDGRWIVLEIMKDIHTVGTKPDRTGDLTGLKAAIERYVAADNRASEALGKKNETPAPNSVSEAIRRFREKEGLSSN
jgi:hypothetical protein